MDDKYIKLLNDAIAYALKKGAGAVRLSLSETRSQLCGVLCGELDKISASMDRSLGISLFANGRFGTFSTNLIERESIFRLLDQALEVTSMMAPDELRSLPDASRKVHDAVTGVEMGLWDDSIMALTPESRREMAIGSCSWGKNSRWKIISEEGEYSDSAYENIVVDSEGLFCRHRETSFEIGYEATVEDGSGNRFSGYWWDASPTLDGLGLKDCSATALARAAAQIGPKPVSSGKYSIVVENECASKLLNPILTALSGYSIQQGNSFLTGKLGEKVFGENFSVTDRPREKGAVGAKAFDSEGVATRDLPIIDHGRVSAYFLNTYNAAKMGLEPTIEDVTRPVVAPFGGLSTMDEILGAVGRGILVTGFNGGNNNSTTGDFSYGIEGFYFEDGRIKHPVREVLMTGNFISLWNSLIYAGQDPRRAMTRQIPTIAFKNIDISA